MRAFKGLNVGKAGPGAGPLGRHCIAGRWETGSGDEVLEIASPSTGEALGAVALGTTSGHGRTGGRHTLRAMCDLKTITFHIGE